MTDSEQSTADQRRRDREALLLLALLSAADVDEARNYWDHHAAASYRGILTGDGWEWDEPTQSYRGRNRHTLDGGDLKRIALMFAAVAVEQDMREMSVQVARRIITLPKWEGLMAQTVKSAYITEAAIASGGFANLTPQDLERIGGTSNQPPSVAFSLDKLAGFGQDIADAAPRADSEAAIVARASLYAAAGNSVYEDAAREKHKTAKDESGELAYKFERNLLGEAEHHCRDDGDTLGCITVTEAGWQPIGTLPLIGLRTCQANCQCRMTYSLIGDALGEN